MNAGLRFALGAALLVAGCATASERRGIPAAEFGRVLAAEDARAATAEHAQTLRAALRSGHPEMRALALRALGRIERRDFAADIVTLLGDSDPAVRAAAVHALGGVTRDSASGAARETLLRVLPAPGADPILAAAVTETLGRLQHTTGSARDVAARIAPFLQSDGAVRRGALRGLYLLARQQNGRAAVAAHAAALADVAQSADSARDRALALSTLTAAAAADADATRRATADPDWMVRREAVLAAGTLAQPEAVRAIVGRALNDAASQVRYEALRVHARRLAGDGCAPFAAALRDRDVTVALLAAGLMAAAECRGAPDVALLDSMAGALSPSAWHRAAAAITALAQLGAPTAAAHVERLAAHANLFARMHAARAAGALRAGALLRRLANDPHANVRTAAVTALADVEGHAADDVYIAQLASDESELIQAAAAALDGSPHARAPEALLAALDRITAAQSETSRDARAALLDRLRELGSATHAARLQRYLTDFDAAIASRAADLIAHWTGTRPAVRPEPLPEPALPTYADLEQLESSRFVLEMAAGGEIEIALLPWVAPTNAWRFARLAREGYFDGLTIHRVVPNFVVQGGSPGANEYSGQPMFSRDELGAPNWRGTVGLSTRGRDTGDAQFYINLIDNVRLDHEYTIFGGVTRGMAVVDALVEGAVIRRVRELRDD